jgi:hypothetical protein
MSAHIETPDIRCRRCHEQLEYFGSRFRTVLDHRFACAESPTRFHEPVDLSKPTMQSDDIAQRIFHALGASGARELLDALTRPETERPALIERLSQGADGEWLAEALTDLDVDQIAQLYVVGALRESFG